MKKLFVVIFMLAATVSFAAAQQGGGQRGQQGTPEERAKVSADRVATLLSLKDDVKAKIQAIEVDINKQQDAERQKLQQGDREAMTALREKFTKIREEKYKAVLTADQFKKWQDDVAQRAQQRGQGGQGQRPQQPARTN